MNDNRTEDVACAYCLEVDTVPFGEIPNRCQHCHVVQCKDCGTFNKGDDPAWCHGCGKIKPNVRARMYRTTSTASLYYEKAWAERNRGNDSDGMYGISSGYARNEDGTWNNNHCSMWLYKENENGTKHDVRELTDEEKAIVNGKTT